MKKMIAASVVAALCHVGTASAGVPGWCKEASSDTRYNLKDLLDGTTPREQHTSKVYKALLKKGGCPLQGTHSSALGGGGGGGHVDPSSNDPDAMVTVPKVIGMKGTRDVH